MWTKVPIAPLVTVYSIGIIVSYYADVHVGIWILCSVLTFGLLLFSSKWYSLRYYVQTNHALLYIFWFCLAACLTQYQNPRYQPSHVVHYKFSTSPTAALIEITDWPKVHSSSISLPISFKSVYQNANAITVNGNAILKSKFNKRIALLKPGDVIQVIVKPSHAVEYFHPAVFNYNSYLQQHHRYGVFWLDTHAVIYRGTIASPTLVYWQKYLKHNWILALQQLHLSSDALALCEALTCGYDDEISDAFMEAFTNSGTLHILSVSGLHVGLIFGFLMVVLKIRGFINRFPLPAMLCALLLLWIFILISGAASPALRAGIMCSAIAIGKYGLGPHRVNTINVLCASAGLILILDPYLLFDVGFQLSFSAILGILCIQPVMINAFKIKNHILKYLWNGISVSIAATITTLPITLYYFKQFPIFFAVANLWAVPLSFIIMLLVLPAFILPGICKPLLNGLTAHLYEFLNWFNVSGITYIIHIPFTIFDAVALSIIIALWIWMLYSNTYKFYIGLAALFILWQIGALYDYAHKLHTTSVFINSNKHQSEIAVKYHANAFMSTAEASADYRFNFKPAFVSLACRNHYQKKFKAFTWGAKTWYFKNQISEKPQLAIAVTDLVVSKNALNDSIEAAQFANIKRVYFTADNSARFIEKYTHIYRSFGVEIQVLKTGLYEWQNTP